MPPGGWEAGARGEQRFRRVGAAVGVRGGDGGSGAVEVGGAGSDVHREWAVGRVAVRP